jgi:hypothetical protein
MMRKGGLLPACTKEGVSGAARMGNRMRSEGAANSTPSRGWYLVWCRPSVSHTRRKLNQNGTPLPLLRGSMAIPICLVREGFHDSFISLVHVRWSGGYTGDDTQHAAMGGDAAMGVQANRPKRALMKGRRWTSAARRRPGWRGEAEGKEAGGSALAIGTRWAYCSCSPLHCVSE